MKSSPQPLLPSFLLALFAKRSPHIPDGGELPIASLAHSRPLLSRCGTLNNRKQLGKHLHVLISFLVLVVSLTSNATTNELIVDGNSLNIEPLNPGGPHGWVLVFQMPANCGKTNIAVSGANALEQINRMQADLTPNLDPACTHRVLHWMEIGNSIAHGSNDLQAFYSYTNYIHFARTNTPSIYIIAASAWSRGDLTGTLNTYRTNANEMVRTTWQQYADAFIDYDDDPRLDYTLHQENFSGDLVHPVTSGVTAITNINMATILAAFNAPVPTLTVSNMTVGTTHWGQ